jgi:hypothetical protein
MSYESLKKFKEIYKKQFGEEISDEEARESGERLLTFMRVLLKVDQKEQREKED